jgi:DNA polymerase
MEMLSDSIEKIHAEVISCKSCELCENRTNAVPGDGDSKASIMFIGEAPGRNEDEKGKPFVGMAGKILEETLTKVGLTRSSVYITNVVKCRPPGNRVPTEEERRTCRNYLEREISLVSPKIICILGRTAYQSLLGGSSILGNRGKFIQKDNRLYFLTVHPAAIIYNNKLRKVLEGDLETLVKEWRRLQVYS